VIAKRHFPNRPAREISDAWIDCRQRRRMLGIDEITGNLGHPLREIDSLGEGHSPGCVRGHATIKIVEIVSTNIPRCADVCRALPVVTTRPVGS
jgi:hypothetical protein